MKKRCVGCGLDEVDTEDVPRYDVLKSGFTPDIPLSTVGPYCSLCFEATETQIKLKVAEPEEALTLPNVLKTKPDKV